MGPNAETPNEDIPNEGSFDAIGDKANEFNDKYVKNSKVDVAAFGFGSVAGLSSMEATVGATSIATEVGGLIVAATGGAVSIGVAAIGIGYIAYTIAGGVARKDIREIGYQIKQNNKN